MKNLKRIFLVAGHGYGDCGAVASDGTTERSIIEGIFEDIYYPLITTIGYNLQLPLSEKIQLVNRICKREGLNELNSVLVSVHCDFRLASSGEMAYYKRNSIESKKLAQTILDVMPLRNKRIVPDTSHSKKRLAILADTKTNACLIECGSLGLDLPYLKNNQKQIAENIINGIFKFGGIAKKISEWAEDSVRIAIEKNIATTWQDPQEIIGSETLGHILEKLGWSDKVYKKGVTKEQFIHSLYKANLL